MNSETISYNNFLSKYKINPFKNDEEKTITITLTLQSNKDYKNLDKKVTKDKIVI